MILFPAIDLKGGQVVRLFKGDLDQATVYGDNPGAQAKAFEDQGFKWLHVVDLDGAVDGKPVNRHAVEQIIAGTSNPIQLGGGIRSLEHIEAWLSAGVNRVILGTVALRNPSLVKQACQQFPGQIVVGIDARDGMVAVEGWLETGTTTSLDLAKQFEDAGVSAIVFTDIGRDGALTGVNIDATVELAEAVNIPVIASGGLKDISDLKALIDRQCAGIEGVISGRALYEGTIDVASALELCG